MSASDSMRRRHPRAGMAAALAALAWCVLAAATAWSQPQSTEPRGLPAFALLVDLDGPIGPATTAFIETALGEAASGGAEVLVIRMDTPGGLDAATRDIVAAILASPVPVVTWVAPDGARAASAGTYILYASHVAAMSPATNVGAATPVAIGGGQNPTTPAARPARDDGRRGGAAEGSGTSSEGEAADSPSDADAQRAESQPDGTPATPAPTDASSRKAVNDAVAYLRGLAEKRGRNAEWAEKAVREAASITAATALELGVIDVIAADIGTLLAAIDGLTVEVREGERTLATEDLAVETLEPGWKNAFLAAITSPTIAYLLLLVGVYGLILEGYNPGAILPGVVGAISLLLALYALQMLPVNYVGLGLILLGVILIIAETLAPSFGVLGFGGIVAVVIGSVILIDTDAPGFVVSRPLIGAVALAGAAGLLALVAVAMKARKRPLVSGREELLGAPGEALEAFDGKGAVFVHGERWRAVSDAPVAAGQRVVVTGLRGLVLEIAAAEPAARPNEPGD